jgi:hypothetical protein
LITSYKGFCNAEYYKQGSRAYALSSFAQISGDDSAEEAESRNIFSSLRFAGFR